MQQLISGRVVRLGAEAEAFLVVAAVVGERWDLAVVEGVLAWPEDALLAVLDQVMERTWWLWLTSAGNAIVLPTASSAKYSTTAQCGRRRKHLHARIAGAA